MTTSAAANTTALDLLRTVATIREFELCVDRLVKVNRARGLVHLSLGNEGAAAGVCSAMRNGDYLVSGHRAHGHLLARGADPYRLLAEVLGRRTGLCLGLGGSMHVVDMEHRSLGATGVVGGNIPIALGAALTSQLQRTGDVAVVFFGDGATSTGAFHESLNLASVWQLPVLFVCENNGVAEFTKRSEHSVVAQVRAFAGPYALPAVTVNGADAVATHDAAVAALGRIRDAGGPFLLECSVRRLTGHYAGDPSGAFDAQVSEASADPVTILAAKVTAALGPEAVRDVMNAARDEIEMAAARALNDPVARKDDALQCVYVRDGVA